MKILVIGKHGQLARALGDVKALPAGIELSFAARPQLDLIEAGRGTSAIESARPQLIINAAAYTAVDQAEREPQLAFAINARGAGEVAAAASAVGAQLVHISTDYVFDGRSGTPLDEQTPTAPVNVYGQSKLAGEQLVRTNAPGALILRTSWVYSPFGSNFVRTMLRLAAEGDQLRVVDDQFGSPTSAADLAAALLAVAVRWSGGDEIGAGQIYHFAGSEQCSWAEFARGIVEESAALGGPSATVVPIATADYPTAATRPAYTVLDCRKFDQEFGLARRGWHAAIRPVLAKLLNAA